MCEKGEGNRTPDDGGERARERTPSRAHSVLQDGKGVASEFKQIIYILSFDQLSQTQATIMFVGVNKHKIMVKASRTFGTHLHARHS